METKAVDVAVIGAGTAGMSARREAAKLAADVVMIEGGPYGTTCARVGCMPSKLLIAAADVVHDVNGAGRFGIEVDGRPRVNGPAVLDRVRGERNRFVGFVLESVDDIPPEQRLRGCARFVAPTTLQVDDHTRVEAKAVVIATGSAPWLPPSLEPVRDRVMVNDDVFELQDLPKSLAVVGTGIVGLEIGQAFHRLGVRTAFFSHSEGLGPVTDPEVQQVVSAVLGAELALHQNAEIDVAASSAGGVRFRWRTKDGQSGGEEFDCVLAAAGRRPNLARLDLRQADVETDRRGVPVFDHRTMQCGGQPIFIAGDANVDRPLLHEAADEGRIAGINAACFPEVRAYVRRTPLSIVFTDPQIAIVGTPFKELTLDDVEIGSAAYDNQGRARVMGKNNGLVRLYADREAGTLLGAEMFGPRVENTAHLLAWAVQSRLTVERALEMPFYHPVIEEGIRTGHRDLCARLKVLGTPRATDLECGPGT